MAKKSYKKIPQWFIIIPVAVLIAVTGYLSIGDDTSDSAPSLLDAQRTIDFFSSNSHTTQFTEEGLLHYTLVADYAEHIQQTDITLLQQPDLHLYRGTDYPWLISGQRGEVSPGGEQVQLFTDVVVERHDEQQRPFLLTTTELTYIFNTDHAHTQADVQIDSEQGVTTATGMHAYLQQGLVQLLSNVRGRYEAQ